MGLGIGRAYRLGEILKSSMGGTSYKGMESFYGAVDSSRKHLKIGGGLGWIK